MTYSYNKGPIILLKAVCTLIVALGFVYSVNAQIQYKYVATTKAKAAAEQGAVKAGSQTWKCKGNECYASGPSATLGIGDCKALAQKVGPLASYGHSGRWLSGKELDACNSGSQKTLPSPGVIQAPKGQLKKALPSPGATQLPLDSLPPAALSKPAQIQLSQSELDSMARTLNSIGSQRYEYVLWRRTPTQSKRMKLSVVSADSINGVLLNRDRLAMERLDWRLFDDRMANLVLVSSLSDPAGNRVPYSVTATSWGENVFAADRNNDGVIDMALGSHRGDSRLWMMANDHFKRLLQCIEEAALSTGGNDMFNAASLCVPCLDPNREAGAALTPKEMGCVNKRGDSASLGGAFNSDVMQALLGEPECGPGIAGAGITSDPRRAGSGERVRQRSGPTNARDKADLIRQESHNTDSPELTDALEEYADAIDDYADELADLRGGFETEAEASELEQDVSEAFWEMQRRFRRVLEVRKWKSRGGDSTGGGTSSDPAIGPDGLPQGDFADPRCAGNKTAMNQGTMWGDFCRREDGSHIGMIECARKTSDSIHAISGGRCWQESGPAGGERIVCRQEESGGGDGPGDGPGDSGPTDDPRTDELGRPRGTGSRYIDTTPMGAFLAGFCAKIGCPGGDPRMDLDRKRE